MTNLWTVGQLAKRTGLRPSTLRYYEDQRLLLPARRTDAGYRLYDAEAERALHFIQRARRLGFSLSDIRALLDITPDDTSSIVAIAESRLLDLERRLTELLVLRREMSLLLLEFQERHTLHSHTAAQSLFDRLVERVCNDKQSPPDPAQLLDWIIERTSCTLSRANLKETLKPLRHQHVHIWQEEEAYQILVVSQDPLIKAALQTLAQVESNCHVHPTPQINPHVEGFLFTASGENAFLFARLFLALEEVSLNKNGA